jgi:FixJ family two-component response regulator
LKVIFSSGYTDEMLDEGSALRQAPNFLEKPFSPNALLRTIRTALD